MCGIKQNYFQKNKTTKPPTKDAAKMIDESNKRVAELQIRLVLVEEIGVDADDNKLLEAVNDVVLKVYEKAVDIDDDDGNESLETVEGAATLLEEDGDEETGETDEDDNKESLVAVAEVVASLEEDD